MNSCTVQDCNNKIKAHGLCRLHYLKDWRSKNKDKELEYGKEAHKRNYAKNRGKLLARVKKYNSKNKDNKKEYDREYRKLNKTKISDGKKGYYKKRAATDLDFRMRVIIRSHIKNSIKSGHRGSKSFSYLGIELDKYKEYLESMFYPNPNNGDSMSWDNWSLAGWHIDHIRPLSSFNLDIEDEVYEAFNYKNTQPMWAFQNLEKGNRYE